MTQNQILRLNRWQLLCVALMVLGIIFRFAHLESKVYWHDEVFTSLEVTGHSHAELIETLFTGKLVSQEELQRFQQLDPNRGLGTILTTLAQEDTQHPPLYLSLLRLWLQTWGESIAITRSLSAVLSLLVFPALYWFCWELFGTTRVGWVAIALVSVSPFQVVYAQEAREYALWTVMTLVSSAALLRAIRLQTRQSWLLYSLTLIVSFYTFLFSLIVAAGQTLYGMLKGFPKGTRIATLTSLLYALIGFSPWLYAIISNWGSISAGTAWSRQPIPLSILARLWMFNFSRPFVDFNPFIDDPAAFLPIVLVLIIEIIAIYFFCRQTPIRVWLLVLILIGAIALPLGLADLFLGGQRSTATRYLVPFEVGLLIPVAYWLATGISNSQTRYRLATRVILGVLIILGILSCGAFVQADSWWNKSISFYHPQMAKVINASDRPLLITDAYLANPGNVISLSYLLEPKTTYFLLPETTNSSSPPSNLPSGSTVFFMNLPETFLRQFGQQYRVNLVPVVDTLWRIKP